MEYRFRYKRLEDFFEKKCTFCLFEITYLINYFFKKKYTKKCFLFGRNTKTNFFDNKKVVLIKYNGEML